MSDLTRIAANHLATTMRHMLNGVPSFSNVSVTPQSVHNGTATLRVTVTGWSASLHRRQMILYTEVALKGDDTDDIMWLAKSRLRKLIEIQQTRHRMALAHHLDPVRHAALDVTKVIVDRATANLLAMRAQEPGRLVAWHRRNVSENGTEREVYTTDSYRNVPRIIISTPDDAHAPILGVEIDLTRGNGTKANIVDNRLAIDIILPETLIAAAPGQRVGDIVDTGVPSIDNRTILDSYRHLDTVVLRLVPDRIPIKEARKITPLGLFNARNVP